jgi:hypothetical protein
MPPLQAIRKIGFRRWYERLLIEAHAWLVSCFLALILAVALFETHNDSALLIQRIPLLTGALFSVYGAWLAYRRYFETLQRAEVLGEDAACPNCGTYARFHVESVLENDAGEVVRVGACCRKCQRHWQLGQ